MNYVDIIGVGMGIQNITSFHMKLVKNCDLLIGGDRLLALFSGYTGETYKITRDIPGLVHKIQTEQPSRRIAILASGDPLFYGIGSTLSRYLPPEQLRIHSNVSSLSAAFAKVALPWQDAKIISLHSRQPDQFDFSTICNEDKLFILTSPTRGPAFIAEQLIKLNIIGLNLCVLENLGDPHKEKVTWFSDTKALLHITFSDPNVVIMARDQKKVRERKKSRLPTIQANVSHETHLGMPENFFYHSKGLITKSEVRALSLSKLMLTNPDHVIWDIGSGSGSVAVEAAIMIPDGTVIAIEKEASRINDIQQNIKKFDLTNLFVHQATFPGETSQLQRPDRIFIGGGGGGLKRMIHSATENLSPGGVIVVNTVVIGNMACALDTFSQLSLSPELIHVQISRSRSIADGSRLSPLNPVWIISGVKPIEKAKK